MSTYTPPEHVFRHEYGKLVAILTRQFRLNDIDQVEDAVQWAMMQAVERWSLTTQPEDPAAWLYRVAQRKLLSALRAATRQQSLLAQYIDTNDAAATDEPSAAYFKHELNDALLRMLFVTCDPELPLTSQLVFTLKSLCGFNVREIALRLFVSEANVYKRYTRAKHHLASRLTNMNDLDQHCFQQRLAAVQHVLYIMHCEGYLSSHHDKAIRYDLGDESLRLALLLADSHAGEHPSSHALLALMHFNLARSHSRIGDQGLLLLEEQDRHQWDTQLIARAMHYLNLSACGDQISRYHIEAGIAAEHCLAPSFAATRWDKITASYRLLEQLSPSTMYRLNHALALAQWRGPEAGLALLHSKPSANGLNHSHYWELVMADLLFRFQRHQQAEVHAQAALSAAPSPHVKALMQRRFARYQ